MIFVFDIETIKTNNKALIKDIDASVTHPAAIKLEKSIATWNKEKRADAVTEALGKTSFDGGAGEIVAFSCSVDGSDVINIWRDENKSEADLLNEVNEVLSKTMLAQHGNYECVNNATWVGHGIATFDLRFLWKRFIVNKIRPAVTIPYAAKPWDRDIYDTLSAWKGASKNRGSMDFVCKSLGITGKDGFDGSMVGAAWENGEYEKIGLYCGDDVKRTREIYNRLNFK